MSKTTPVSWLIVCDSNKCLELADVAAQSQLNTENHARYTYSQPAGVPQVEEIDYSLGDLFGTIQVERDGSNLKISFEPKPDADSYWKDLMVRFIKSVGSASGGSIRRVRS